LLGQECLHAETAAAVTDLIAASDADNVAYQDLVSAGGSFSTSVDSLALKDNFYSAAVNCRREIDVRYCQMLANMCVLQMYDETASACNYFQRLERASQLSSTNGFSGWYAKLGFLYFESSQIALDSTLTSVMAFDAIDGYVHSLRFVVTKYAFNGTYLGQEDLTTQLQLCGGHYDKMTRWLSFGVWFQNSCNLRVDSIINSDPNIFYDPYFIDSDGTYYPVPIMVMNLRVNGQSVNTGPDTFTHKYTRRFMQYDTISGVVTAGQPPNVIRVISEAKIKFTLQTTEIQKMFPPIMEITYAEVDVTNLPSGSAYTTGSKFSTGYFYDIANFEDSLMELLITMTVFVTMVFLFRGYRWKQLNYPYNMDINSYVLMTFLFQFCHAVGTVVGIGIIGYSWYWYTFYKW